MNKRPMNQQKAVKLAVAAIKAQIQKLAFDANLYQLLGEGTPPGAKKAYERRQELREAINLLEGNQ